MTTQVEQFAEAASNYCHWAEGSELPPDLEAQEAIQHLSNLYRLAVALPASFEDSDPVEPSHDAWTVVHRRFASMPFNYYCQCFDPQNVPDETPAIADVADDLADIWRDLRRGLSLHGAGHTSAACWEWRESFWQHWGHHAAGALYAVHCWVAGRPGRQA